MIATISSTKGTRENIQKEAGSLVLLGVLEVVNDSEWGSPSFTQPTHKSNWVRFISDFRNLNKQVKQKPMPKANEILFKLEVFQYATSLDLNMGYYNI